MYTLEYTTRKYTNYGGISMIGRKEELDHLKKLYESDNFEFLVMYGRRRVGKTTILQEFAKNQIQYSFLHVKKMMH